MRADLISGMLNLFEYGAILVNPNGDIFSTNKKMVELLGYTESQINELNYFDINPHYSKMDWRRLWKKLEELSYVEEESEFVTSTSIFFSARVRYLKFTAAGIPCCLCTCETDIKSQSFKNTLNVIADFNNISSWRLSLVEDDFFYTDKLVTLLCLPADKKKVSKIEAYKQIMRIASKESFVDFKEKCKSAIYQGGHYSGELDLIEKGKSLFYVIGSIFTEEKASLLFGTFQDLSILADRSEDLIMGEFTLENAREMIFWVNKDAEICFVNEVVCEKLGYSKEEVRKLTVFDTMNASQADWEEVWEEVYGKSHVKMKEKFITSSGDAFPVELDINFINYKGVDYLCTYAKDISDVETTYAKLENAYEEIKILNKQLSNEKEVLLNEIAENYTFDSIITSNEKYKKILSKITQVAPTDTSVLILGETGTGKELLARSIHRLSDRSKKPLIKINCAALPENLIESELFGYEKGAFTGAVDSKPGKFELADGATIFLDEIGELPLSLQPKLLRVLQEGEVERLGATKGKIVDVRVIASTNRDPASMVEEGKFRSDLYYRLNVFPVENLPLRERKDDIPMLVKFFIEKYSKNMNKSVTGVLEKDLERLKKYDFPGNVRELENLVNRALIYSTGKNLNLKSIFPDMVQNKKLHGAEKFPNFEDAQRQHIVSALKKKNWKITGKGSASELLEINGKTLASKMRKLGIQRGEF